MGDEYGVTIFAGRAYAVDGESLKLEGVVRLADERRRRAVRVTGSMVTLPPAGGPAVRVATLDISRGAVRLPIGDGGWTYDDPLDLVVHLGDTQSINVLGRMLRVDARRSPSSSASTICRSTTPRPSTGSPSPSCPSTTGARPAPDGGC